MNNYKVKIGELFDGIASTEELQDMYDKGFYMDPNSPTPERVVTVDGAEVSKDDMLSIIQKAKPELAEYQILRKYPSIGDQLDALFHAGVFPAEMAAEIQAVKDKYPKT